jgi:hypothetical protein
MWIRRRPHSAIVLVVALALCGVSGCVGPQISATPQHMQNPVFVPASDYDVVWESAVDVMHSLQLPIQRESKLDGIIETDYKVGAGLLEPWHQDAVTFSDRKELENPDKLIINSPGHSTFQENTPLQRDLNVVIGPATPDGWIPQGRDPGLEQSILARLQAPGTY